MATTTNYSWTTPDDTDLVKDGASAIRTLGSSADTTVKALNPGTTAGDIDYYTAATTKARIAIGTAGQILAVNAGTNAPEWVAAPTGGGMTLISTTTLTGASVSLTSIPQTYNNLQLVLRDFYPASGGGNIFRIQFNSDTGTNYGWAKMRSLSTSIAQNNNIAQIDISDGLDGQDNTAQDSTLVMNIYDYTQALDHVFESAVTYYTTNAAPATIYTSINGVYRPSAAAAISSIQIFASAGNINGTALLYGVK